MSLHARGPLSENVQLDDERDQATIYGVKVSGVLLRTIGEPTPRGRWFRIIKVEDGVATIQTQTAAVIRDDAHGPAQDARWSVRPLTSDDFERTLFWRHDEDVIASAEQQSAPTGDEHARWMAARLEGSEFRTWIVDRNGVAVGMFTVFSDQAGEYRIGYMVDREHRGLGYAQILRGLAIKCIRDLYPDAKLLRSRIRVENVRSLAVALKMGSRLVNTAAGFAILEAAL